MLLISAWPLSFIPLSTCLSGSSEPITVLWWEGRCPGRQVGSWGFQPSLNSEGTWANQRTSLALLSSFVPKGWDEMERFQMEFFQAPVALWRKQRSHCKQV